MEGRILGKFTLKEETSMETIEFQTPTVTKLERIAWLSAADPNKVFHQLMHHFNKEELLQCFYELDGKKAVGVDGMTKSQYVEQLDSNIEDLIVRMKRMGYRPGPVRQVLIPKEGKPGATRPLGISNFEDKIFQKMMQKVLESIYEPLFLDCSFGFRPKRGCHDAIKALRDYLNENEIETVIDIDLANFFGSDRMADLTGEDLHKAAHMGAPLVVRELDADVKLPQYARHPPILFADHHRQVNVAHADAINGNTAIVSLCGYVIHRLDTSNPQKTAQKSAEILQETVRRAGRGNLLLCQSGMSPRGTKLVGMR